MKRGTSISFLSLLMLLMATTAQATDISTITVDGVEYSLFSGFTVTAGHGGGDYSYLVDGNDETRWSSSDLKMSDEDYEVQFQPDDNIDAIVPKGYTFSTSVDKTPGWSLTAGWSLAARMGDTGYWTYLSIRSTDVLTGGITYNCACDYTPNAENKGFNRFFLTINSKAVLFNELRIYGWYYTHLTAKAATCTETGNRECYYRSDGKYFTDLTGETELSASDVIEPIIPHTGVHGVFPNASIECWHCSVCGKYFSNAMCTEEIITSGTTSWTDGRYIVFEDVTIPDRITVSGQVILTLCDNTTLTASQGIHVGSGSTLQIDGNSTDEQTMGRLIANTVDFNEDAAIGGNYLGTAGTIVITGGKIEARSNYTGAGIGSGFFGQPGDIYLKGGVIMASSSNGSGIGSGCASNGNATVNIYDGVKRIEASSTEGMAIGNGYGYKPQSGTVAVNFYHGDTAVTGTDKDAIFYDTGGGDSRIIRSKAWNHNIHIGNELQAHITPNTPLAIKGETITLALDLAVDETTLTVSDGTNNLTLTDKGNRRYSFVMPEGDVSVAATLPPPHSITIGNDLQTHITASAASAYRGETVTLTLDALVDETTLTVSDGTNNLTLTDKGNRQYSFIMPDGDVSVTATILTPHSITIGDDLQAHVTASAASAYRGETITLTLDALVDETTLNVSDGTNNLTLTDQGNRQYSFVMPDGDVSVTATILAAHSVSIGNDLLAHVTASAASAYRGETVTLTLNALVDETTLTVSDGTNNVALTDKGNRQYSFVMPDGDVTVTATLFTADLRDGVAYDRTSDFVVAAATYRKTLGEERVGKHQAWLVPFDYTITNEDVEKFTFYKINMIANSPSPSVEATDEMWVFLTRLDAGAILHANMPYVYKSLEAVTDYAFTTAPATLKAKNTGALITMMTAEDTYTVYATYANTTATADNPFYYVSIDGGISLGNDGTVAVGPYRWIIRKESKFGSTPTYARRMYFYDGEETTGIASPKSSPKGKDFGSSLLQEGQEEAPYDLSGRKVNSQLAPGVYVVKGKKVIVR